MRSSTMARCWSARDRRPRRRDRHRRPDRRVRRDRSRCRGRGAGPSAAGRPGRGWGGGRSLRRLAIQCLLPLPGRDRGAVGVPLQNLQLGVTVDPRDPKEPGFCASTLRPTVSPSRCMLREFRASARSWRVNGRGSRPRTHHGGCRVMIERASLEVETLTIRIPIRLQRRGGRKLIMTPEGVAAPAREAEPRRDAGQGARPRAPLAARESRAVRRSRSPTLRSRRASRTPTSAGCSRSPAWRPDIVEAILDGRQPKGLRLAEMLGNGPLDWKEQRTNWGFSIDTNLLKKGRGPTVDCRRGREGLAMTGPATAIWLTAGPGPDPQSLCVVWDCRNHLQSAERSGEASTSVATIPPAEGLLLMLRVHERVPCPSATVASTRPFTPGSAHYTLHSLPGRRSDNPRCFDEGDKS